MRWLVAAGRPACQRPAAAAETGADVNFHLASHPVGWLALVLFVLAYVAVIFEERINIAKSKPVMLGAALIWGMIAWKTGGAGSWPSPASAAFEAMFLEYAEIFFFLVVAMTYVTAMGERNVFEALRDFTDPARLQLPLAVLDHRPAGVLPVAGAGQPHHRAGDVGGDPGRRRRQRALHHAGDDQPGGRGQCRRCLERLRRHHHADGVAGRQGAVLRLLPAVPAGAGELAGAGRR